LHKLGNELTADDKKYQQKSGMVYPCKRGNYHKAGRQALESTNTLRCGGI